jgi:hypothetical protein
MRRYKRLFKSLENWILRRRKTFHDLSSCGGCTVGYAGKACQDRVVKYGIGYCYLPDGTIKVEDERAEEKNA